MSRPLFQLDNRLALCAQFVRTGCTLADIGTDHAYLPVWLAKAGIIKSAVAADLRPEPLLHGETTIAKYHAQEFVKTRLSDGLKELSPAECEDIVIAGMGGELIVKILSDAPWIKDKTKRLILQPMSRAEVLREYLCKEGFEILREQAVLSLGRIYSVMQCAYTGVTRTQDEAEYYRGKLQPEKLPLDKQYINNECTYLQKKADGLSKTDRQAEVQKINQLIEALRIAEKK